MKNKIESFIEDLRLTAPEQAQIVEAIRQIYADLPTEIEERFIYGGVGFFINGTLIGGAYANKKHVSMVFSRGNELQDEAKLLEGKGKFRRHLKLPRYEALKTKRAHYFAAQIVALP